MSFQVSAVAFSKMGKEQLFCEDNLYFAGTVLPADHQGIENLLETHFSTVTAESLCLFDGISEEGYGAQPLSLSAAEGFSEAQSAIVLNDSMDSELFGRLLEVMNRLVNRRKEMEGLTDAGTSALCVTLSQDQLYVSWVGDSSIYCVRQEKCRRLNQPQPGFSKLPAQYLGLDEKLTLDPRVLHGALLDGDQFLLVSGNLSEVLSEERVKDILLEKQSMISKGRKLLELAEDKKVEGDVTLILFRAEREHVGEELFAGTIGMAEAAVAGVSVLEESVPDLEVTLEPAVTEEEKPEETPDMTEAAPEDSIPLFVQNGGDEEVAEEELFSDEDAEDPFGEEPEEEGEEFSFAALLSRFGDHFPKKWRPVVFLALALVLVILIALFAFGGGRVADLLDPRNEVPDILTLTEQDAIDALAAADLVLEVAGSDYSDTVKEGGILSQTPIAGEFLDDGAVVSVVLSLGEEPLMPNLEGLSESVARTKLKKWKIDLEVLEETVYSETAAEGTIAEQSVKPGSVLDEEILKVSVKLSKGSEYVDVPSLEGLSKEDAKNAAEDAGFVLDTTGEYSDTVPKGEVISQDVAADGSGKLGSTITVTVSKGPAEIDVPDVAGWWQSEAEPKLENLGFVVDITAEYNEYLDYGRVVWQSESGSAAPGSTITLCISLGSRYPEESEEQASSPPVYVG